MSEHWWVITPEYTSYYYQDEPPEIERDSVCVEAKNKREAKIIGLRELRKISHGYMRGKDADVSPFTGLEVTTAKCEHGACWCDICSAKDDWIECPQCMAAWDAEDKASQGV